MLRRSYGIREQWIHFCSGYFDVYLFFKFKEYYFILNNRGTSPSDYVYFVWPLVCLIMKLPVTVKRASSLFGMKFDKFIILATYLPDILTVREQRLHTKDPWLF